MPYTNDLQAATCSPGIPCTGYDVYSSPSDNISKSGDPSCDSNFMNQIYSRAFMEASREVIMSEQIIHKPDSVLEYTCFDQFISMAAHNAGPIFSESSRWNDIEIELWTAGYASAYIGVWPDHFSKERINFTGAKDVFIDVNGTYGPAGKVYGFADQLQWSVFSNVRLDHILEDFILVKLQDYIDNNFDHTFLGEGITIDNNINSSIGPNSYTCSHMSTVWNIAKCIDFGEDDRFRSFEHLVNSDPRSIPRACSPGNVSTDAVRIAQNPSKLDTTLSGSTGGTGGLPSGGLTANCPSPAGPVGGVTTGFSNDIINVANNCSNTTNPNVYAAFDTLNTYFNIVKGFDTSTTCSDPLPTGVPVITYQFSNTPNADSVLVIGRTLKFHYDHVCPNAGCYYTPNKVSYIWGDPLPASTSGTCSPF